jgi:hypothetical protein
MITLCGMSVKCTRENNPAGSADSVTGVVILSEDFEGTLENYRQLLYTPGQGMMSISALHARAGKGALTADSNNTSIKKALDPSITDSIAGLRFFLMATKAAHTGFFASLCKNGSSRTGMVTFIGMGIDTSDSIECLYEDLLNGNAVEHRNVAALTLNKWYKCAVEYDFTTDTLTYFLDDAIVHKRYMPDPSLLSYFVAMRDDAGEQGVSGYYMDDVVVYKR